MWYVYIVHCSDGSLYTGITDNLEKRILTHNSGKGARYTRARLPVFIVYTEEEPTRSAALKREYAIKKMSRKEKDILVSASKRKRAHAIEKTDSLQARVLRTISEYAMLPRGSKVLVAVSGGRDSVTLLRILFELKDDLGIQLFVAHLDHSLRGKNGARDCRFTEKLAARLHLPFYMKREDVATLARIKGYSIEESARHARYSFFCSLQKELKLTHLATGHTRDDQAETVLMRIAKGTGLQGLAGVRACGSYDGFPVVRPLIESTRSDIDQFVKKYKIRFVEDETNSSEDFVRNKIRHSLLPLLEQTINPQVKDALARLAHVAESQYDFMRSCAESKMPQIVKSAEPSLVVLDKRKVRTLHPALHFYIFARALELINPHYELSFDQWRAIRDDSARDEKRVLHVGCGIQVRQQYDEIIITVRAASHAFSERTLRVGETLHIPEYGIALSCTSVRSRKQSDAQDAFSEYFDERTLTFPLRIRPRQPGDSMVPLGMRGKKKIKNIFIDKKVPLYEREKAFVVLSGDTIIWLAPYVISDLSKVKPRAKKIVKLTLTPLA
jgi:tRNA(Ile)-lysidine synthase